MKKIVSTLAITTIAMIGALPALAQERHVSPHETISARVGGDRITITYGRPYAVKPGTTEVRKIWGGLVPYGQPWRMGADEATTLITQQPLDIGGKTIPAGTYTLYMLPEENGPSKLVFSTALGGWGIPVDTKHDLVQVDLTKTTLEKPVDQFTIGLTPILPGNGATLTLSWEKIAYYVQFNVKR